MKNIILIITVFLIFAACDEDTLTTWGDQNYVSFKKEVSDSTVFSFILNSDKQNGNCTIPLEILGQVSDVDRTVTYRVVDANTTAIESVHYQALSGVAIIEANKNSGSINIPVINNADLKEAYVILELEIIPNKDFICAFQNKISNRLIITDQISRPLWWDLDNKYAFYYSDMGLHQKNGLGTYSDKKYQLFVDITQVAHLNFLDDENMTYDKARSYMLQFKYWLIANPQTEVNGELMVVTIKG